MKPNDESNPTDQQHNLPEFRCPQCGYEILNEAGQPEREIDRLAAGLLSNSDAPHASLFKCGKWMEGVTTPALVRHLLEKAGYELTFDDDESGWRLERWEHPDGQFRLIALHGKGFYMADSVEDERWAGILDLLSIFPDWSYMEDVLELVVYDSDNEIIEGETLQPGKAPETDEEWQSVVEKWLSDPQTRKEPGTTLALLDLRRDKNLFTYTFE